MEKKSDPTVENPANITDSLVPPPPNPSFPFLWIPCTRSLSAPPLLTPLDSDSPDPVSPSPPAPALINHHAQVKLISINFKTVEIDKEEDGGAGPSSEPYVGMEFDTEEEARGFYADYARRVGFVVRVMQRRRSGVDGRTLARRLGCNKQGFSPGHRVAGQAGRASAREGCKATVLFKVDKGGKWVVSRFHKDHNHPLVATANGFSSAGDKDKKIEELTVELERQEQLCAVYRQKLLGFINDVEEQTDELSSKIRAIVDNVKKVESEVRR